MLPFSLAILLSRQKLSISMVLCTQRQQWRPDKAESESDLHAQATRQNCAFENGEQFEQPYCRANRVSRDSSMHAAQRDVTKHSAYKYNTEHHLCMPDEKGVPANKGCQGK